MYDLGDKKDGNNHSFIHEDATSIMLNTIFCNPARPLMRWPLSLFKTIFSHHSLGIHIAHSTIVDVNLNSISCIQSYTVRPKMQAKVLNC